MNSWTHAMEVALENARARRMKMSVRGFRTDRGWVYLPAPNKQWLASVREAQRDLIEGVAA